MAVEARQEYGSGLTAGPSRRSVLETLRDYGAWSDHEYAVRELAKIDANKTLAPADIVEQYKRDLASQGEKVKSLLQEKMENPYRAESRRAQERRELDRQAYERAANNWKRQVEELQVEVRDLRGYTGLQSANREPVYPALGSTSLKTALMYVADRIPARSTNARFLRTFATMWAEQVDYNGKPFSLYGFYWWALLNLADALSSPSIGGGLMEATLHSGVLRTWGEYMKARTRWELSLGPVKFLPAQNQSI